MSRDHDRADFEEFVAVCAPRLLRTAHLLTGDADAAEALLRGALARTRASWRRLDDQPEPHARTLLVRAFLAKRSPSRVADRSAADPQVAALGRLPRPVRAVAVLRHADGLDVEDTAEVVDCSPATVRAREEQAATSIDLDALVPAEGEPAPPLPLATADVRARLAEVDRRAVGLRRRRAVRTVAGGLVVAAAACTAWVLAPPAQQRSAGPVPAPDAPQRRTPAPAAPDMVGYPLPYRLDVNDVPYEYFRSEESPSGRTRLRVEVMAQDQPQALAWATPELQPGQVVVRVDGGVASRSPAGSFQTGLLLSASRAHVVVVRVTEPSPHSRIGLAIYHWPQPVLDSQPADTSDPVGR